ncbi:MAG: hypothetical protein K8T90_10010 [Planctomycetes bacterium]|nr:hypothetical protein [Planctomycetota bacterium]
MRIVPVVAALIAAFSLTSAACTADAPSAASRAPEVPGAVWPWPADLELPLSGVAGDLPPLGETVVISCSAAGVVRIGDETVGRPADLVARLAERVDRSGGGSSPTNVLLAFDGSVPWRAVAWTVLSCAHPKAAAPRVFFAVRHAGDQGPGAFATFLPEDRCIPSPDRRDDTAAALHLTVRVTADAEARDAGAVGSWLVARRDAQDASSRVIITLAPDPDAPLAAVIAAADAAARGGAAALLFLGTPGPTADDTSWFVPATGVGPARRFGVHLPPGGPSAGPTDLPIPPRVRGLAGFADSAATWEIESKPEEQIVEDEAK